MKKTTFLGVALAASIALLGASTAAADGQGATTSKFALGPITLANTCVSPPDVLAVILNGNLVVHMTDQVHMVRLNVRGTATAADGTEYIVQLVEQDVFYHDPYPSWGAPGGTSPSGLPTHLKLQLISKGGEPNWEIDVALHFNEHGEITRFEAPAIECKG